MYYQNKFEDYLQQNPNINIQNIAEKYSNIELFKSKFKEIKLNFSKQLKNAQSSDDVKRIFQECINIFSPFWMDYFSILESHELGFKAVAEILKSLTGRSAIELEIFNKQCLLKLKEFRDTENQQKSEPKSNIDIQPNIASNPEEESDAEEEKVKQLLARPSFETVSQDIAVTLLKKENCPEIANLMLNDSVRIARYINREAIRFERFLDKNAAKIQQLLISFKRKIDTSYSVDLIDISDAEFGKHHLEDLSDERKDYFRKITEENPFEEVVSIFLLKEIRSC
jgi:hypothetical protein